MVVTKELGVRLEEARPWQQVLKVKIDGAPHKREATLESAVWQATLRLSLRAGFLEQTREGAHPPP